MKHHAVRANAADLIAQANLGPVAKQAVAAPSDRIRDLYATIEHACGVCTIGEIRWALAVRQALDARVFRFIAKAASRGTTG